MDSLIFISSNLRSSPAVPWATRTKELEIVSESGLRRLLQSGTIGRLQRRAGAKKKGLYLMTACIICGNLAFEINWLSPNWK